MNWQEIFKKAKTKKDSINKWLLSSTIGSVLLAVFVVSGEVYSYLYKDQDINVDNIKNVIKDTDNNTLLESSFSNDSIRADLIMPNGPIDVYKLVRISSTDSGTFYDLMVMTIINNEIFFVDTVETSRRNEWVFTGPPGKYSIRLTIFNPETGFNAVTGSVVIGNNPNPLPQLESSFLLSPTTVKVGEDAVLTWTTKNASTVTLNGQVVELNGSKVVAHSTVGSYPYVLTAFSPNGQSISKNIELVVSANPGPGPGPIPTPEELKTQKYGFGELSFRVVTDKIVDPKMKVLKEEIANNFEAVAAGIAAGSWKTPQQANTELAGRNRLTLSTQNTETFNTWRDTFFTEWAKRADELNKSGKLPNLADAYREAFLETVKGLRLAK